MRRVNLALATAAAMLLAVPAANAGLIGSVTQVVLPTCGSNGQPFAQFGDTHAYYGFANNGFESGSTGWTLSGGASVGKGNEPWLVNGAGSHSLTLPAGASATSPAFCINLLDPAIRAFAHGTAGGDLKIQVIFHGLTGNLTGLLNFADVAGTNGWAPTSRVSSSLALPVLTVSAQIRVTAASGAWQVDDAFVDPYINGAG
jgi:hypothetical protein